MAKRKTKKKAAPKKRKGTSRKPKTLTHQQSVYCELYVANKGNGTEAAKGAGYAAKSAAQRSNDLQKNPLVVARIAELRAAAVEQAEIEAKQVVQEWGRIGFSDIRELVTVENIEKTDYDDEGNELATYEATVVRVKPTEEWTEHAARAVSEISQGQNGAIKLKLYDKRGALQDIGKYLGILVEKKQISGPNGGPIPVEARPEDLSALSMKELEQLRAIREKLDDAARPDTKGD